MTLRNPRLFGLNVLSYLADVEDKNRALTSLNLPPLDMEVISGSSETATNTRAAQSISSSLLPLFPSPLFMSSKNFGKRSTVVTRG